jgi:anti-sigma B factor antagonist
MDMTTRFVDEVRILALQGRFDAHEVPKVAAWLKQASMVAPACVVVNLADVHFIDSTALGVLVQGMKNCRMHGGDVRVCALQQPVRIIFELTRLDRAFALFASEDEALQAPWQ